MGIERIVRERHLLGHPFYQRWQKGKVSVEVIRRYAEQYYHYESALPSFLESACQHLEGALRRGVEQVLADEAGNPKPHAELWLDFARALGLDAETVRRAEPLPRTSNLVQTYRSLCRRGPDEALAALYAYESQVPEVALAKAEGLRSFYGVTESEALSFFELHTKLDVEHTRALKRGLKDSEPAREAAHLALDGWWGMLDQFESMAAAPA